MPNYYGTNYPSYSYMTLYPAPSGSQTAQQAVNNIIWVTNRQEAESYPISTGSTLLMMERNTNRFYIKSVNQYGVALPLEAYSFTPIEPEPKQESIDKNLFVTKDEFNELKQLLESLTSPSGKKG